tara:strand:+ start:142 stop:279 length:138 start_codon:yes stop_codon:yes gene_type:complete
LIDEEYIVEANIVDIDNIKIYFSKFSSCKKLAITKKEIEPKNEKK